VRRKDDRGRRTRDLRHELLADGHLEVPHIADCENKRMVSANHAVLIVRYNVVQREGLDQVSCRLAVSDV
jgi:hypothetical protein